MDSSSMVGELKLSGWNTAADSADFMDEDGAAACLDPYANVFFSKERTETLLEPALQSIYAQIPLPNGEDHAGQTMRVRVLSRGEWMSGCPEGSAYFRVL